MIILYVECGSSLQQVENYLCGVKMCLPANKVKLNPDKTEFFTFHSKKQCKKKFFPFNILGYFLSPAQVVRNLGVWFYTDFSFLRSIQNTCKTCFAQIQDPKYHRGYLTCNASLMASRLDYCYSLFRSLSALDLCKLACIQNSLTRIFINATKFSQITPVRKTLHWLPFEHDSVFMIALPVYKFLQSGMTNNLNLLLHLDRVCSIHPKVKLMVCCLMLHTLFHISQPSISGSALYMMLQRFAMICLLPTHSE